MASRVNRPLTRPHGSTNILIIQEPFSVYIIIINGEICYSPLLLICYHMRFYIIIERNTITYQCLLLKIKQIGKTIPFHSTNNCCVSFILFINFLPSEI